jgi:AsmA protein
MKRILRVLGIVIALLLVIALALPFLIDADQFRPRLEAELTQALGRNVKLGHLDLSVFSGAVAASDLSIADDPAFSKSPFVSAKSLKVGVELQPLIFSRKLNVTGIQVDKPEIALIQSPAGAWNFASLGGKKAPKAEPSSAGGSMPALSVKLVKINGGQLSLTTAGEPKPEVLENVDIEMRDFTAGSSFPFSLTADVQGGGTVKLDGKAGPINAADTSETPFDAMLKLDKVDIVKSGFVNPATGFGSLVSLDGDAASTGHELHLKGTIQAEQIKLAKGGTPAREPVRVDFTLFHDLQKRSGSLSRGDIQIGKAKAALTGTYQLQGNQTLLNMKLAGPAMAVDELTPMLPALNIVLPRGSSLHGGTAAVNLTVVGPTDKLMMDGSLSLKKTRLAGFDLGSNMKLVSELAGIHVSPDTDFDNISADVHATPDGTRIQNISVIAPAIGELSGAGTTSPAKALDFKMQAKLQATSGVLSAVGGAVPFLVRGTSSEPKFLPDIKGVLTQTDVGKTATGIIDLFRKKKQK